MDVPTGWGRFSRRVRSPLASVIFALWCVQATLCVGAATAGLSDEGGAVSEAVWEETHKSRTCYVDVGSPEGAASYRVGVRAFAEDDEEAAHNLYAPYVGIAALDIFEPSCEGPLSMRSEHAWDNREHQFWKDRSGPLFSPRGRATRQGVERENGAWKVWLSYVDDEVETRLEWTFPTPLDTAEGPLAALYYDVSISVQNIGSETREQYVQFFANYDHKQVFFWAADGRIVERAELGLAGDTVDAVVSEDVLASHREAFESSPHQRKAKMAFRHPVLMSEPREGGYRHIICCEEDTLAFITSGMGSYAMDYCIEPPDGDLSPGESFKFRARHYFARISAGDELAAIEQLWNHFTESFRKPH